MEHGTFAQEYFCRLCASEGVVIHPLFPPGDDDPKHELVRMIEVLTSVHLALTDDAGAVICDKCLQMLDLFCKFREECLRQDVLIRSKRTMLTEELERHGNEPNQQHVVQFQQLPANELQPVAFVKLEDDDEQTEVIQPVIAQAPEEIICTPTAPLVAIENSQNEYDGQFNGEHLLIPENDVPAVVGVGTEMHQCGLPFANMHGISINENTYPVPGFAVFSQTGSLSISVQVNQLSPEGTDTTINEAVVCDGGQLSPVVPQPGVKRKTKPNFKKPPPECEVCRESFATYYEYDQHMNRQHDWDRSNRCSLACDPCQMRFTKSYNLKRHMYEVHGELPLGLTVIPCEHCGKRFLRGNILERHIAKVHRNKKKLKGSSAIKMT